MALLPLDCDGRGVTVDSSVAREIVNGTDEEMRALVQFLSNSSNRKSISFRTGSNQLRVTRLCAIRDTRTALNWEASSLLSAVFHNKSFRGPELMGPERKRNGNFIMSSAPRFL